MTAYKKKNNPSMQPANVPEPEDDEEVEEEVDDEDE